MPDSGQNFLDLLFGGVQQGLGQFRKQQAQETDLFLTLQQMLGQQRARQQQAGFEQERIGIAREAEKTRGEEFKQQLQLQKDLATQRRMTEAGEFYHKMLGESLKQRRLGELAKAQISALNALSQKRTKEARGVFTPGQINALEKEYTQRKEENKKLLGRRQMIIESQGADSPALKFFPEPEPLPDTFEKYLELQFQRVTGGLAQQGINSALGTDVSQMTAEDMFNMLLE